jgi:phosphoglycerol transferase MdoB-like AlkP superfamily enzyme
MEDTAGDSSRFYAKTWFLELGILTAAIASLWIKQLYVNVSERTTWTSSSESLAQWSGTHLEVFSLSLASVLLLFCLLPLMSRAWRFGTLISLNLILTSIIVADLIHIGFFGLPISVPRLGKARMMGAVTPDIIGSIRPVHVLLYFDVVAAMIALPLCVRFWRSTPQLRLKQRISLSAGLLGLSVLLMVPSTGLISREKGLTRNPEAEVCSSLGLFPYHFWDILRQFAPDRQGNIETHLSRIKLYLAGQRTGSASTSSLFGVARGQNLILLSAESIQAFAIGLEVNGQQVTPNLSQFIEESLYFTEFYDQTGLGRTLDAEFIALNSLHAPPDFSTSNEYQKGFFYGLPALLARHGYRTLSACGASGGSWDMRIMHPRYGIQQSFFEDSFEPGEHLNGDWLADRKFFPQVIAILQTQKQPFMAFLLSSSSHGPYEIPVSERTLKMGKLEGTTLGNYLHAVRYFDQAFGEFIEGLRKTGLLDQSVVVIYGDHKGIGPEGNPEFASLLGQDLDEYSSFRIEKRVPLVIRLPYAAAVKTVATTGGHLDIAPTLLSLLGIGTEEGVMLGRDLTSEEDHLVIFRDGSFADGQHYFISRPDPSYSPACYEVKTGLAVPCVSLEQTHRAALERLEISDLITNGDLIATLVTHGDQFERSEANDLRNPSFEDMDGEKPSSWELSGDAAIDASPYARSGKFAVFSKGARDVVYQTIAIRPNRVYVLEWNARASAPNQQGKVQVNWFDTEGNLLKEQIERINVGEDWQYRTVTMVPPIGSARASLYLSALDPSAVWFDDLFFGETK